MTGPSGGSGQGGQRKALVIANDLYEHEGLGRLLAPSADAEALSRVLGDPRIGGFDVRVVCNEPAHVVQGHIEDMLTESRPDDVVLLHFSCHGLKNDSGELFFAARNTRPTRLGSTAVSADFVQRCMRTSRSRSIVLFLDCCYGGAFHQGVTVRASGDAHVLDAFPTGKLGGGRGRAVITASSSMEYAFEDNALTQDRSTRPSLFTNAVVEGLSTGDADRDEDGWISLNELYDYVFDRVHEQNPQQTPSRNVEMQGELYLARSRRRRIRPRPIPADLDAARTDPNMYSRMGAVTELRTRLTSNDLPVALGAYVALAEMARTDVRFVAEPAAAAVLEATLRPTATEVQFGSVLQGSEPPRRTVSLYGPPIARVCTARAVEDWIHVRETDGGLDIWVDTRGTGLCRGSIDVTGPTGAAVIAVVVEVRVPAPRTDVFEPPAPQPSKPSLPLSPQPSLPPAPALAVTPQPAVAVPELYGVRPYRNNSPVRPALWALMPVLSFGLLSFLPLLLAAKWLDDRDLLRIAKAYLAVWLVLVVVTVAQNWAIALLFLLACVVSAHAWRLRKLVFSRRAGRRPGA